MSKPPPAASHTSRPTPLSAVPEERPESDPHAVSLIRRYLCAHQPPTVPLEHLLPAFTSSTDVDIQLYAFVAIICQSFILSWYANITSDHSFIDEIVAVIAHCTRSLEERLRKINLEVLLLEEVSAILENHVEDYRRAVERHGTALAPHLSVQEVFYNFQPHRALTNPPESERLYLKLLTSGILAVLLPTEDLGSDVERILLREILGSTVLMNIVDKLSEPFMLYEIIIKLLQPLQPSPVVFPALNQRKPSAYQNGSAASDTKEAAAEPISTLERIFTIVSTTLGVLRNISVELHHFLLHPLPKRDARTRPVIRSTFFSFISTYLQLPRVHPWLPTTLRILSKPIASRTTSLGVAIDDVLSQPLRRHLYSSKTVVGVLKLARTSLFPNDKLGPPREYPSEAEKEKIRRSAEAAVMNAIPEKARNVYFSGSSPDEIGRLVGRLWLDPLQDKEINKVLFYRLLDLVVSKLLPELTEAGPAELRRARLGEM